MRKKHSKPALKKFCICCQQLVSARTEFRHRQLQAPPRIKASSSYQTKLTVDQPAKPLDKSRQPVDNPLDLVNPDSEPTGNFLPSNTCPEASSGIIQPHHDDCLNGMPEAEAASLVDTTLANAARLSGFVLADESDSSDEEPDETMDYVTEVDEPLSSSSGLEIWDELGESFERDLAENCECEIEHTVFFIDQIEQPMI
jgi:hypothetical protein